MEERRMKKKKPRIEDADRISKLSDDLIYQIMFFMDIGVAVRTSILSKRWKRVWTTLPFLSFDSDLIEQKNKSVYCDFVDHVFSGRNRKSRILTLELCPNNCINLRIMKKYVKYAISHKVQRLKFKSHRCCSLSLFKSESLTELELEMNVEYNRMMKSVCWSLPNLTTLYLKSYHPPYRNKIRKFPESCLMCLPALTTLGLEHLELPESLCLPALTRLRLKSCSLPTKVWDLPAVLTLELCDVFFPQNMSDYFFALTSLQNLTIDFLERQGIGCCVISSFELVTLTIMVPQYTVDLIKGKIVVLAPKLCNFNATGFFRTRFEGSELENVYIKFWDFIVHKGPVLKEHQDLFQVMFSQLGSTKILTLDLATLKALSEISNVLEHLPCPFYNLKYLKLPYGCDESSISSSVRQYILSGSPSATIVKTLSRDEVILLKAPAVSPISQNVVLEEPLATPTMELNTCDDTVDMRVPEEDMVENSLVDAEKVREIEAPVGVKSKDRASNSLEKSCFVLWRGHEVNSEYVGLLDLIMKRYPETFEKLTIKNKKIWTMKLNMLCSSVNAFTKTSMTDVDRDMLTEYRDLFADLQSWGFNIDWLMGHYKYIKHLYELYAIDSRIDIAKSKLQDVQTLHAKKLTDSESLRTVKTGLPATARYIGDGLL